MLDDVDLFTLAVGVNDFKNDAIVLGDILDEYPATDSYYSRMKAIIDLVLTANTRIALSSAPVTVFTKDSPCCLSIPIPALTAAPVQRIPGRVDVCRPAHERRNPADQPVDHTASFWRGLKHGTSAGT